MAVSDINKSLVDIVNEVQRKLGLNSTTTLVETKLATVLLDLLNDVLDEVSDSGDWPQMFREITVTSQSSVGTYEIAASSNVKNVYEAAFDGNIAPLNVVTIEDMRRLQRLGNYGTPRHIAIIEVSGVNVKFRVAPVPTTAAGFDIAYYKKPQLFVTSDLSAVPSFPSRVLVQGLYAKALLEENGGEPSGEYQTAYAEYLRMRREALNRLTADTGTDVYMVPRTRY